MLVFLVTYSDSGVGVPELKKTVRIMIYVTLKGKINLIDLGGFLLFFFSFFFSGLKLFWSVIF